MQKKKKGISLIVLVITIIVMLILATTIIISLSNNDIIDKAHIAVDKTNEREVQELVNLAWADAYAENTGKSEEELVPLLKQSVEKALSDNNLDKEDYYINVTTSGVTIKNIDNEWIQKSDRTVVKGNTTLNIGDYVNYVSGVEGYTDTNGWQVLGAENGELLIMSATDVASKYFNEEKTLEGAKDAYENGISELNEICAPYGKGAYATKARSITVEDVDRVTGYDKTQYGKGQMDEYGNIVTYSYNRTNRPAVSGSNGATDFISNHDNGFYWYDLNNVWYNIPKSDFYNTDNYGKEIAKVKNTYYKYDVSSTTNLQTAAPNAYNMLFGLINNQKYWLASSQIYGGFIRAGIGLFVVFNGYVAGSLFARSDGTYLNNESGGVRAVVTLSSDYNP